MVSSNKVLTVSYGTFSCTAQGFEDPLDVLKDATQVFRDVVKEDRSFGATPTSLDSKDLEDWHNPPVSARRTENGVILSPATSTNSPTALTAALTPDTAANPVNASAVEEKLARIRNALAHKQDALGEETGADPSSRDTNDDLAQRAAQVAHALQAKHTARISSVTTGNIEADNFSVPPRESGDGNTPDPAESETSTTPDAIVPINRTRDDDAQPTDMGADDAKLNLRKTINLTNPAKAFLTESSVQDGDASRLMEATDSQFDEPEGNRRRSAIAHLRAAVAATRADRKLGHTEHDAEQNPYREDLADAVGPQPEQRPARKTEDPTVIDREPSPVEFATYADDVGAENLSELLESAVAFLSIVDGRDQFSRQQLMATLGEAETKDSSREDRLRSLGQLLGDGKIKRTQDGKFTMTHKTGFRPVRAAG